MKKYISALFLLGVLFACTPENLNPDKTAVSVCLGKIAVWLQVGDTEELMVTVVPSNTTDKLKWSSSDVSIATVKDGIVTAVSVGSAKITATAGSKSDVCTVVVRGPAPEGAVDLGLSVCWAKCNLSDAGFASSPDESGDHYAWGEIKSKSDYSWSTYAWCNGTEDSFTKYNYESYYGQVDDNLELDRGDDPGDTTVDDAARARLGGKWRMPTSGEWAELRDLCTWTWKAKSDGYALDGYLVTAANGNSIFLPAAGYYIGTELKRVGLDGNYWSSDLGDSDVCAAPNGAAYIAFTATIFNAWWTYRCNGVSVRPVID